MSSPFSLIPGMITKKRPAFGEEDYDYNELVPPTETPNLIPENQAVLTPPPAFAPTPEVMDFQQDPDPGELIPKAEALAPEGGSEAIASPPNPIVEGAKKRQAVNIQQQQQVQTQAQDSAAQDFHAFNNSQPITVPTQGRPKPQAQVQPQVPNLITPAPSPNAPNLPSDLVSAYKSPEQSTLNTNPQLPQLPQVSSPSIESILPTAQPTLLPQLESPQLEQVVPEGHGSLKAIEQQAFDDTREFLDIPEAVVNDPEKLRQYVIAEIGAGRVGKGMQPIYQDSKYLGKYLPTNYQQGTDSMNEAQLDNERYKAMNQGLNLFALKRQGQDLPEEEYATALNTRRTLDGRVVLPIPKTEVDRIYKTLAQLRSAVRGGGELQPVPLIGKSGVELFDRTNENYAAPLAVRGIGFTRGLTDEVGRAIDTVGHFLSTKSDPLGFTEKAEQFGKYLDPNFEMYKLQDVKDAASNAIPQLLPRDITSLTYNTPQERKRLEELYKAYKGYGETAGSVGTYVAMGATGPVAAPAIAATFAYNRRQLEQQRNQDIVDALDKGIPLSPEQQERFNNDPTVQDVVTSQREYKQAGQALGLDEELSAGLSNILSPLGRGIKEGAVFAIQPVVESTLLNAVEPLKKSLQASTLLSPGKILTKVEAASLKGQPLATLDKYLRPIADYSDDLTLAGIKQNTRAFRDGVRELGTGWNAVAKANPILASALANSTSAGAKLLSFPLSNMAIATATGQDYSLDQFKHDFAVGIFLNAFHVLKLPYQKGPDGKPAPGVKGVVREFFTPVDTPLTYNEKSFSVTPEPVDYVASKPYQFQPEYRALVDKSAIDLLIQATNDPNMLSTIDTRIRESYLNPSTSNKDLDIFDYARQKIYDKQQALKASPEGVQPIEQTVDNILNNTIQEVKAVEPQAFESPAVTGKDLLPIERDENRVLAAPDSVEVFDDGTPLTTTIPSPAETPQLTAPQPNPRLQALLDQTLRIRDEALRREAEQRVPTLQPSNQVTTELAPIEPPNLKPPVETPTTQEVVPVPPVPIREATIKNLADRFSISEDSLARGLNLRDKSEDLLDPKFNNFTLNTSPRELKEILVATNKGISIEKLNQPLTSQYHVNSNGDIVPPKRGNPFTGQRLLIEHRNKLINNATEALNQGQDPPNKEILAEPLEQPYVDEYTDLDGTVKYEQYNSLMDAAQARIYREKLKDLTPEENQAIEVEAQRLLDRVDNQHLTPENRANTFNAYIEMLRQQKLKEKRLAATKPATQISDSPTITETSPRTETPTTYPELGLELIDSTDLAGQNPQRIARVTMDDGTTIEFQANPRKSKEAVRQDGFQIYAKNKLNEVAADIRSLFNQTLELGSTPEQQAIIRQGLETKQDRSIKAREREIADTIVRTARMGDPEVAIQTTKPIEKPLSRSTIQGVGRKLPNGNYEVTFLGSRSDIYGNPIKRRVEVSPNEVEVLGPIKTKGVLRYSDKEQGDKVQLEGLKGATLENLPGTVPVKVTKADTYEPGTQFRINARIREGEVEFFREFKRPDSNSYIPIGGEYNKFPSYEAALNSLAEFADSNSSFDSLITQGKGIEKAINSVREAEQARKRQAEEDQAEMRRLGSQLEGDSDIVLTPEQEAEANANLFTSLEEGLAKSEPVLKGEESPDLQQLIAEQAQDAVTQKQQQGITQTPTSAATPTLQPKQEFQPTKITVAMKANPSITRTAERLPNGNYMVDIPTKEPGVFKPFEMAADKVIEQATSAPDPYFSNAQAGETRAEVLAERKKREFEKTNFDLFGTAILNRMFSSDPSREASASRKLFEKSQERIMKTVEGTINFVKNLHTMLKDVTQSTDQVLARNFKELGLQPYHAKRVMEFLNQKNTRQNSELEANKKQVTDLQDLVRGARRSDGRPFYDKSDRLIEFQGKEKLAGISSLMFDALHAIKRINPDGSVEWNDQGVVWDHIKPKERQNIIQAIRERFPQYEADWKEAFPDWKERGLTPPIWNESMFNYRKDPFTGEFRIWKKWEGDQAKDLYAQAVTGGDVKKFADLRPEDANQKIKEALAKFDDIRHKLAAEEGIEPIDGYVHHFLDDTDEQVKREYKPKLKYNVASPRYLRTGKLWRTGKASKDVFLAYEKMLNAFTKESSHNEFIKKVFGEIAQQAIPESEVQPYQYGQVDYGKFANVADSTSNFGARLNQFPTRDTKAEYLKKFGFNDEMIESLASTDPMRQGLFLPHVVMDMLKYDMREDHGGILDQFLQREGSIGDTARRLNAFINDLTNLGVVSKLQLPSSGTRDFVSSLAQTAIMTQEATTENLLRIARGEAGLSQAFLPTIRAGQAIFNTGKRGVMLIPNKALGRENALPQYLQESNMPDSYYKGLTEAQTTALEKPLWVAGQFARFKSFFDTVGKRLAADAVANIEADRYIDQVRRTQGIKDTAKLREMRQDFLDNPSPEALARIRMTVNEFQFGGDNLNPNMLGLVDNPLVKNFATPFPRFALKLGAFLNQRLNPLNARNLHARLLETNPEDIEIGERELATQGLDDFSIASKLSRMDKVFREHAKLEIEHQVSEFSANEINRQLNFLNRNKSVKLAALENQRDPQRIELKRQEIQAELNRLQQERDAQEGQLLTPQQDQARLIPLNKRIADLQQYLQEGADPFAFNREYGLDDFSTRKALKMESQGMKAIKNRAEFYEGSSVKRMQTIQEYINKYQEALRDPNLTPEQRQELVENINNLASERDQATETYQEHSTLAERGEIQDAVRSYISHLKDNFIKRELEKVRSDIENPQVDTRDINKMAIKLRKELRSYLKRAAVPEELVATSERYLREQRESFIKDTKEQAAKYNQTERDKTIARLVTNLFAVGGYALTKSFGVNAINPNPVTDEKNKRSFTPSKFNVDMAVPLKEWLADSYLKASGISPVPEALARLQLLESGIKQVGKAAGVLTGSPYLTGIDDSKDISLKDMVKQQVGQGQLGNLLWQAYDPDTANKGQSLSQNVAKTILSSTPGAAYLQKIREVADPYKRKTETFADEFRNAIPGFSDSLPVKRDVQTGELLPSTGQSLFGQTSITGGVSPTIDKIARLVPRLVSPLDVVGIDPEERELYGSPGMRADTTTPETLNTQLIEQGRSLSPDNTKNLAQKISEQQLIRQRTRYQTLRAIETGTPPEDDAGVQLDWQYLNSVYKTLGADAQQKFKQTFAQGKWYDMDSIIRDATNEGLIAGGYPDLTKNPNELMLKGTLPRIARENPDKLKYNANATAMQIAAEQALQASPVFKALSGDARYKTGFQAFANTAVNKVFNRLKIPENAINPSDIETAKQEINTAINELVKQNPGHSLRDILVGEITAEVLKAQQEALQAGERPEAKRDAIRNLELMYEPK